ncbi:MAG TPA: PA14 domain-containing protein, partial [Chthoniobacterales bacterium]
LPAGLNANYFVVRWSGQVQPQYSETYYFDTVTDDGVKLWVNGQLISDHWGNVGKKEWIGGIDLQGGVLYDIKMEYEQYSGSREAHLYWYSSSQVKQIIPANRLYPATTVALPTVTAPLVVYGFLNQPFSYAITATNSANLATNYSLGINSGPLPPGLTLNASTGLISGIPTQAGDYQVAIVATNANGLGSSVLDIQIIDSGNAITREVWTSGVSGPAITDIPVNSPPTSVDNALSKLEDNTAYEDNTAERLRGYFTAPATANYYFWIAASNAAELWISNDKEPVNKVRRAWVTSPGTNAETWDAQPSQKSAWISLIGGRKYYFEVLHNHGTGTANDNVAVAWFRDPTGITSGPVANGTGVVPGYLLSPFDYPAVASSTDTLYSTNMQPQGTSLTTAVGSANLRFNAAHTQAILHFTYSGLSSPRTAYHIHMDPYGNQPSQIIYDIDDVDRFHPELKTGDGGYIWNLVDVGATTAADIVNIIQQGKAYINIHTVNYGAGEIRGNFSLVQGSQTAPTLQPDPGAPNDANTDASAARFLNQATFGASPSDV